MLGRPPRRSGAATCGRPGRSGGALDLRRLEPRGAALSLVHILGAGFLEVQAGVTLERVEQELRRLVVDGKESKVTFDEFPYYLSEQTRVVLTSAAYVHLKQAEISKYTRNLAPASRAILLSGPAELYQQMLAKALAHYFEAKILLLDPTDFLIKLHGKYGTGGNDQPVKRSISETTLERMSGLLQSFTMAPQREQSRGNIRRQNSMTDMKLRCGKVNL